MGPYLWFVLILSVLALIYQQYLFGAARNARNHDPRILASGVIVFLVATLWLLASYTLYHSDDLRKKVTRLEYLGSRIQLPAATEPGKLRIEISGGQIGPVLTQSHRSGRGGEWITRSIWWDALQSGAQLELDLSQSGGSVSSVAARTSLQEQIVRVNGICVNTPSLGWVGPGQTMTFYLSPQTRRAGQNLGGFTVSVRTGSVSVDWRSPTNELLSSDRPVPLRDSRTLWNVISTAGSAKILQGLTDSATAARVSTSEIRNFLERCVLVRRGPVGLASGRRGLTSFFRAAEGPVDSPVGLLWPELSPDQPLTLTGSVSGTSSSSEIAPLEGIYTVKVSEPGSETGLEAYLFGNPVQTPQLQTNATTEDSREYLDFRYKFPYRYHLPPESELEKSKGEFLLATQELGLSEPGYVLPSGNLDQVFTRRATIDKERLKVTYVGTDRAQVPVNTPHTLGDGVVAPLVQFASPLANRDPRSGWMLWSLILSVLLWGISARYAWGVPSAAQNPSNGESDNGQKAKKTSKKRPRWRPDPASWKLFAIQIGVWMVVTALLSIRAILAYRATMDPPGSLAPVPAAGYESAWRIAVAGFIFFEIAAPLISLSRKTWVWIVENRGNLLFTLSGALAAVALLAALLWDLDHFFWRRFSTTSSLLQVAMLIALASPLLRGLAESHGKAGDQIPEGKFWKVLYSPWLLLPIPILLVVAHPGYGLHVVALAPACAFVLLAGGKKSAARAGLWLLAVGATILVFLPLLSGAEAVVADHIERGGPAKENPNLLDRAANFITKPYQLLQDSDAVYRTVATAPTMAEKLLVAPDVHTGFRPQKVLDSLQQRWQMRLYMSADGQGYFSAPLEDRGLSRGTMLSDGSYCTFLVGEHGIGAGWAMTGCLCVLSLMLFYGALFWRRVGAWGQLAYLASAAGLFGFPAIYMSYASLWAVPFAGQNYPFLGLSSLTEITLYSGLALLAIGLFNVVPPQVQPTSEGPIEPEQAPKPAVSTGPNWSVWYVCYTRYLLIPTVLSWLVLGGFFLWGRDSQVKQKFHLDDSTFRALDQDAAAFNRERSTDTGPSGAGGPLSITRTAAYKSWGASVQTLAYDAEVGTGQTPFRLPEGLEGALEVDHTTFERNSPFSPESELDWQGALVSLGADAAPTILVPGTGKSINLDRTHPAISVKVFSDHVFVPAVSSSVDVRLSSSDRSDNLEDYGSFFLDENGHVDVSMSSAFHSGTVVLNGRRNPAPKTKMLPGDTLTVSNRSHSVSFIYMGRQPRTLSMCVWRNGTYRRIFPQGDVFPLAAGISDSLNSVASITKRAPKEVKLSVDLRLQSDLQESIRQWCIDKGRPTSGGVKTLEQAPAFTTLALVDLSGGQIRSLVSEPQSDPAESAERLARDYPRRAEFGERASRSSWALQPAPVGSTVKALTFSAVASKLDGVSVNGQPFDMSQVSVDELNALRPYQDPRTGESQDRYRALGDLPLLQRGILSEAGNERAVDPREMLRRSRNWPAVVFGSLGLVSNPRAELPKFLQSASGQDSTLTFRGRPTQLNFQALTGSLSAWTDLQHMFINSQNLEQTCLAKGLIDLFSPRVLMFEDRETPWPKQTLAGLLPVDLNRLADPASKGGVRWGPLTDSVPEAHVFDTRLLSSVDTLCDYLAGKGEARWSALDMAGNIARLVTGTRINPTFKVDGDSKMDSLGGVFARPEWRRQNLIDPLISKVQDGRESPTTLMYPLAQTRKLLDSKGMKLMFKTGTMDDGGGPVVGRESEMVMFVVGRYGPNGFDRKESVAGFLSIRSARPSGSDGWLRGPLLARVIPDIVGYLSSR